MKKNIYVCFGACWLLVMSSCINETISGSNQVESMEIKGGENKVLHSIANFSLEISNDSLLNRILLKN